MWSDRPLQLQAVAQFWGLIALHLADDLILPFNYLDYSVALKAYTKQIEALLDEYKGNDKGLTSFFHCVGGNEVEITDSFIKHYF